LAFITVVEGVYCAVRTDSLYKADLRLVFKRLTWNARKDSVRAAQLTHTVSVIQTSQALLCKEIIEVCSEVRTNRTYAQYGQNVEFFNVTLW